MGDYNKIAEGVLEIPTKGGPVRLSRQVNNRVKGLFEDWLESNARRRCFRLRQQLGEEVYAESMQHITTSAAAGLFRWGAAAMQAALKDVPGLVKMIELLCKEAGQHDMTPDRIIVILKDDVDRQVLMDALKEVFSSDPNFQTPPPEDHT